MLMSSNKITYPAKTNAWLLRFLAPYLGSLISVGRFISVHFPFKIVFYDL